MSSPLQTARTTDSNSEDDGFKPGRLLEHDLDQAPDSRVQIDHVIAFVVLTWKLWFTQPPTITLTITPPSASTPPIAEAYQAICAQEMLTHPAFTGKAACDAQVDQRAARWQNTPCRYHSVYCPVLETNYSMTPCAGLATTRGRSNPHLRCSSHI